MANIIRSLKNVRLELSKAKKVSCPDNPEASRKPRKLDFIMPLTYLPYNTSHFVTKAPQHLTHEWDCNGFLLSNCLSSRFSKIVYCSLQAGGSSTPRPPTPSRRAPRASRSSTTRGDAGCPPPWPTLPICSPTGGEWSRTTMTSPSSTFCIK